MNEAWQKNSQPELSIRTADNGYQYIKVDGKWVSHNRYVMEQKLGRKLLHDERVRYKDGDKTNHDPNNLEVFTIKVTNPKDKLRRLTKKRDELNDQIRQLEGVIERQALKASS